MSKSQLKHKLVSEIKKVNYVIDKKILRGLPYTIEARKHKLLSARLSILNQTSFLARTMRIVNTMMF